MALKSKPKRVLVALDGSDRSFEVAKYIARVALFKKSATRFVLYTVYNAMPSAYRDLGKDPQFYKSYSQVMRWEIQKKKNYEAFLEKAKTTLVDAGLSEDNIQCILRKKQVGIARDIVKEAHSGYDAVMIGRKGTGLPMNVSLGSVATKLLNALSDISLAVIGRDVEVTRQVLLPLDTSEGAHHVVDFIADNLAGSDYRIHLFHAVRDGADLPQEVEETLKGEIESFLGEYKSRLVEAGIPADDIHIQIAPGQRSRAQAIMETAAREGVGTIVMGRRGIHKVPEFFMGRVSNKVIQMARTHAVWIII